MIAKIGRGTNIVRLVRYLFGPGRYNEHTNQRVIGAADALGAPCGVALSWDQVSDLGRRCDAPHADFGVEVGKGHVWHLSLSNHRADRPLRDGEWVEVARRAMDAMGFTGDATRAPWRWEALDRRRHHRARDDVAVLSFARCIVTGLADGRVIDASALSRLTRASSTRGHRRRPTRRRHACHRADWRCGD